MATDDTEEYTDDPIIQYANRIQKLMAICTSVLHDRDATLNEKAEWLVALLDNFPPSGKEALNNDYTKLITFQTRSRFDPYPFTPNREGVEFGIIYGRASDWFYVHILQDLNKARPLFRYKGSLKEGKRYSDNGDEKDKEKSKEKDEKEKSLGESADA